jgi:DNA primase
LAGFGGRTLGADDAKYINSSDGVLFHKSGILFNMHRAKDAIRETGRALLVEGYFDVLACNAVGALNAVATCGTALTEQHVKLLKRYASTVTLCLDSDTAGRDAMERAFLLLAREGIHVEAVILPEKDPSDTLQSDAALLKNLLTGAAMPYIDTVLEHLRAQDLSGPVPRREALRRLLPLLNALPSAVERSDYVAKAASVFGTTQGALDDDLRSAAADIPVRPSDSVHAAALDATDLFSSAEIALGLFLCYPKLLHLLPELIPPETGPAAALYAALRDRPDALPDDVREPAAVLALYCEQHQFHDWSDVLAAREIRKHCKRANREMLRIKQEEITRRLIDAQRSGKVSDEVQLQNQYQQVLRLMKMAS